jgi:hypothetical protein
LRRVVVRARTYVRFNDEAAPKEGLMSVMTIQISNAHVEAIRESLLTARRALEEQLSSPDDRPHAVSEPASGERVRDRLDELDSLLEQIDSGERPDSSLEARQLTGARMALWTAVYDAACSASERLAEELNDYWRGTVDAAEARASIADLGGRFELLESLGPPPGE